MIGSSQATTPGVLGLWFSSPWALWLLALPPVLWWVLQQRATNQDRRLAAVLGSGAQRLSDASPGRRRAASALLCGGIACLVLAAADPCLGFGAAKAGKSKLDVVVCLDVSRSMLARDVAPSRLAAAKHAIDQLTQSMDQRGAGDNLALVAFAGEARLLVPRTADLGAYRQMLELATPQAIRRGGTNLGGALQATLKALAPTSSTPNQTSPEPRAAVLLITDGEDHDGLGLSAAEECAKQGVVVHCVGFGSPTGAKIALEDGTGESFLRDRTQQEVISAMNPDTLRRLAETTGGSFLKATDSDAPLVQLYSTQVTSTANLAAGQEPIRRYPWPLGLGIVLLLVELGFSRRGQR